MGSVTSRIKRNIRENKYGIRTSHKKLKRLEEYGYLEEQKANAKGKVKGKGIRLSKVPS